MKQEVRIIGGLFRGKKISFPEIDGLRPTPDRVRETLFNWLMRDIRNASCLDAFAGSGALGFEAFSRGAKTVTFIEQSQAVYTHLKKQAQTFQSAALKILHMNTVDFLKTTREQFDIIFFDPPFSHSELFKILLEQNITRILKPGGLLYVESPEPQTLDLTLWNPLKSKQAGRVYYGLYEHKQI